MKLHIDPAAILLLYNLSVTTPKSSTAIISDLINFWGNYSSNQISSLNGPILLLAASFPTQNGTKFDTFDVAIYSNNDLSLLTQHNQHLTFLDCSAAFTLLLPSASPLTGSAFINLSLNVPSVAPRQNSIAIQTNLL
jgi:hypothetical protein